MITLYGADLSAPSNKVRFTLHQIKLQYEYQRVNLRAGEHRGEAFLKLNPVGKIPVLDDNGFRLSESGAICKYLARKTGSPLYPDDIEGQARVDEWADFATLHVGQAVSRVLFNRVFAPRIGVPVDENSLSDGLKFLNRFLPVVENRLAGQPFLALEDSPMTLADISLLAVLDPVEVIDVDITKYPNLQQWRILLQQQDFYTKCHAGYAETLAAVRRRWSAQKT